MAPTVLPYIAFSSTGTTFDRVWQRLRQPSKSCADRDPPCPSKRIATSQSGDLFPRPLLESGAINLLSLPKSVSLSRGRIFTFSLLTAYLLTVFVGARAPIYSLETSISTIMALRYLVWLGLATVAAGTALSTRFGSAWEGAPASANLNAGPAHGVPHVEVTPCLCSTCEIFVRCVDNNHLA